MGHNGKGETLSDGTDARSAVDATAMLEDGKFKGDYEFLLLGREFIAHCQCVVCMILILELTPSISLLGSVSKKKFVTILSVTKPPFQLRKDAMTPMTVESITACHILVLCYLACTHVMSIVSVTTSESR